MNANIMAQTCVHTLQIASIQLAPIIVSVKRVSKNLKQMNDALMLMNVKIDQHFVLTNVTTFMDLIFVVVLLVSNM